MALQGSIRDVESIEATGEIVAVVRYFDDAAASVTLDLHRFTFAAGTTLIVARAAIIAYGQALRTRLSDRSTAAASYVGQTIAIP